MTAPDSKTELLIVDDDPLIADALGYYLGRDYAVTTASTRAEAVGLLRDRRNVPALALIDLGLPPTPHRPDEGFALIADILAHAPGTRIVVLSGQSDELNARHARALGATEFVAKPADPEHLRKLIGRVLSFSDTLTEIDDGLIGQSAPMQKLRAQLRQFARSPFPVLIEGESGSGKELAAAALHRLSERAGKPYLALNCAAISPNLVEATLFGHSKGAFTGASGPRAGYFEDASDGTLFLDEIGELPLDLQPKLLRVLENGEFQRVGGNQTLRADVRIIAATNREPERQVAAKKFREDLFYRLNVVRIHLPALRDRRDDIPVLVDYFLQKLGKSVPSSARGKKIAGPALKLLIASGWLGNVRELENAIARAAVVARGDTLTVEDLPLEIRDPRPPVGAPEDVHAAIDAAVRPLFALARKDTKLKVLPAVERELIIRALEDTAGNQVQTAKLLGITRATLRKRIERFGIARRLEVK